MPTMMALLAGLLLLMLPSSDGFKALVLLVPAIWVILFQNGNGLQDKAAVAAAAAAARQNILGAFPTLGNCAFIVTIVATFIDGMSNFVITAASLMLANSAQTNHHATLGEALAGFINAADSFALKTFVMSCICALFGMNGHSFSESLTALCNLFGNPASAVHDFCSALNLVANPPPPLPRHHQPHPRSTPKCKSRAKLLPNPVCDSFNNKSLGTDMNAIENCCRHSSTPFSRKRKAMSAPGGLPHKMPKTISPSASEELDEQKRDGSHTLLHFRKGSHAFAKTTTKQKKPHHTFAHFHEDNHKKPCHTNCVCIHSVGLNNKAFAHSILHSIQSITDGSSFLLR